MHTTPPLTQTMQAAPSQFGQAVGQEDDSEEVENEQSVVQSSTGSKRFKAQSQSHGPPVVQREASSQQDAGEESKKPAVIEGFAVLKHMNDQTGVIKDMRREAQERD